MRVTIVGFTCMLALSGLANATTLAGRADDSIIKSLDAAVGRTADPRTVLEGLKDVQSSTRLIGATKGQVVVAYAFFYDPEPDKHVTISFDEKERNTLFADQFKKLLEVAKNVSGVAAEAAKKPIRVVSAKYVLRQTRADLTVTANVQNEVPDVSDVTDPAQWFIVLDLTDGGTAKTNKASDSITVSTGPREPWSISADLPVNHVSELKINDTTHTLENKEAPGLFYAGIDYAPWGDALGPASRVTDAFVIKFLGKVSKKPLDSYGVGVALRPGFFKNTSLLQILDTLSPFVAMTWTREDKQLATGEVQANARRRSDFRVGLSFNIDKAIELTKKKDDAKGK